MNGGSVIAAGCSLIVPGFGQFLQARFAPAVGFFAAAVAWHYFWGDAVENVKIGSVWQFTNGLIDQAVGLAKTVQSVGGGEEGEKAIAGWASQTFGLRGSYAWPFFVSWLLALIAAGEAAFYRDPRETKALTETPDKEVANDGKPKLVPVPANIEFGTEVLRIPFLNEGGVTHSLWRHVDIECHVAEGTWVNRYDKLVTLTIHALPEPDGPWFLRFLAKEDYWRYEVTAPVSGLVIGLEPHARSGGNWPVILLPTDEPPQASGYTGFYRDIQRKLEYCGHRLAVLNPRDIFYSKANDPKNELSVEPQVDGVSRETPDLFPVQDLLTIDKSEDSKYIPRVPRNDFPNSWIFRVQDLRASDLILRDKLVHLVKAKASEQSPPPPAKEIEMGG